MPKAIRYKEKRVNCFLGNRRTFAVQPQGAKVLLGAAVHVRSVQVRSDLIDLIARSEGAVLERRRARAHKVQARHIELAIEMIVARYFNRHTIWMLFSHEKKRQSQSQTFLF